MGSTAEQRGYYFNSGRRTVEQHLPGRRSTQGRLENQNEDWNYTASPQPSNFCDKESHPSTQNDSSVAGWAVRPKLRKPATSAGPRTEEFPKSSITKSKTQWKTLEVDSPAPVQQQQQTPPTLNSSVANNAWAARNQPRKSEYPSLNSYQQSEGELQTQQDALLALKLQEEEEKLAAAWQRGGRKKQAVNQTSEAFPALLPPPSVLQGENTPTLKPQENAEAQKPVSTFSSVQQVNSPANVAKSTIPLTEKKTLGVELGHDDVGEVFESDEDLGSDNEDQTHGGGFEVAGNSKRAGSATFLNRNLANQPKRGGTATSVTFSNRNLVNRPENTATSATFPNRNLAYPEKVNTATSVTFPNQNVANREKIGTSTSVNFPNRNHANHPENAATSAAFPNRNFANPEKASTASSVNFPNRNVTNPKKASTATSPTFPNPNFADQDKIVTATSVNFPDQNFANSEKINTATSVNFPNWNHANRPENAATSAAFPNRNFANPKKASTATSVNFANRNVMNPEKISTATSPTFPNQNIANREKVGTATSVNFPNGNLANPVATYPDRNLPNNQQQFTASVTSAASIGTPQAQSEFHSEGLVNQMSQKSHQESVLKTTTNSPTPAVTETVVQVLQPVPLNTTDVLQLAEHIAYVRSLTENAHCVNKEAQEQWRKIETMGFKIEESFSSLHNTDTMGMPVLQANVTSALNALRAGLTIGLTRAKAFVQRYAGEPSNPTQNNMEPILMSLPGGGTAVMMRPTSAPTTPQRHPLVVDAFSLGMTAVNLYRKIREEWAGTRPVSSASETNVLCCKEKVEALQRQQHPQHIHNLISEACCDALFICHLALDMVAHSRNAQ